MEITPEDRERWVPDQIDVINRFREVVQGSGNPLVHLNVIREVRWTAKRGSPDNVRDAAQALINSIRDSFDLTLTKFLTDSYDHELYEYDDDVNNWQEKEQQKLTVRTTASAEFVKRYPDPAAGLRALTERLREIIDAGVEPQPMLFLHALSMLDDEYAVKMCEELIQSEAGPVDAFFGNLLHTRQNSPDRTIDIMWEALRTDRAILHRGIAWTYQSWARTGDLSEPELGVLRVLLASSDESTKYNAMKSLAGVGRVQPRWAIDCAVAVDIGNSSALAEGLCEIFDANWGIPGDSLNESDIQAILAKFETVNQIEGHEISQFLSFAAKRLPQAVIRLILSRIDRDDANHDREYRPLPYNGFHEDLSGVFQSKDYEEILREVRDRASAKSWSGHFWLPKLFVEISDGFGPTCLRILNEWIESDDGEKIEGAATLVGDAYANFVFRELKFVENLLNRASLRGEECYRRVCSNLRKSANSQTRVSRVGTPAPQAVSLRDQSRETASKLVYGCPAQRFYQALTDQAEAEIRSGLLDDEELLT